MIAAIMKGGKALTKKKVVKRPSVSKGVKEGYRSADKLKTEKGIKSLLERVTSAVIRTKKIHPIARKYLTKHKSLLSAKQKTDMKVALGRTRMAPASTPSRVKPGMVDSDKSSSQLKTYAKALSDKLPKDHRPSVSSSERRITPPRKLNKREEQMVKYGHTAKVYDMKEPTPKPLQTLTQKLLKRHGLKDHKGNLVHTKHSRELYTLIKLRKDKRFKAVKGGKWSANREKLETKIKELQDKVDTSRKSFTKDYNKAIDALDDKKEFARKAKNNEISLESLNTSTKTWDDYISGELHD